MSLQERIERHFNPTRFSTLEHVELEKAEMCPANEQDPEPYPVGFFKALTRSGIDGDLGFYCDRCHLLIQLGLLPGQSITHCKKTVSVPKPNDRMETRAVGEYKGSPHANPASYLMPVGF